MVMLSRLRTFDLVDARGRRASRPDFRIGMADGDYPPVTDLIFRNDEGQEQEVPVENLERIDTAKRQLVIKDLSAARPTEKAESETEVLLDRDVKDAMVLDLQNRRAVRANDLWLEYEEGELKLKAADIGIAGILRRISRERLGWIRKSELYDWKYVEFLTGDPTTAR